METHNKYVHNKSDTLLPSQGVVCEYCGRGFGSRAGVTQHVKLVHQMALDGSPLAVQRNECTICQASFINKYRLKKHMESVHMGVPQKCTMCDKIAPNASALYIHIRHVHVDNSYKCKLCDKSFKAAVALKDHIATHTGEKNYKCAFCPEAFIWRPNMYSHQKKAHPIEWKNRQLLTKAAGPSDET